MAWDVILFFVGSGVGFCSVDCRGTDASQDKVAVVNGTVITLAQFDREFNSARQRVSPTGKPIPASQLSEVRNRALERLIDRELLYQESQKKGIGVDMAVVDEKFKKQFPDEAKFKSILNSMNMTEADIKSQWLRGMAIRRFVDQEFVPKVQVTEKDAKAYYNDHLDFFRQPEQVRASHMLTKVDPKADKSQKAEARKRLEEIAQRLKRGEDFSVLTKETSQCASSARGGDLG